MYSYFSSSCFKTLLVFLFTFFISYNVLADSLSAVPLTRIPDFSADTSIECTQNKKCNHTYYCSNPNEWLFSYVNVFGERVGFTCRSCPTGYERSYLYKDGVAYDDACIKPCPEGSKLIQGSCESCPEVYKEWRIDDPAVGMQCLTKKCPAGTSLDTADGSCKVPEVICPSHLQKVYSYESSKPYCTYFCQPDEYRTTDGKCAKPPSCPLGQQLKVTTTTRVTTVYKQYSCEPIICEPDEELIDGRCEKKQVDPCDPKSNFYTICSWYHNWTDWRTDYNSHESIKHDDNESIKLSLDQVREQDSIFYDEIRNFLENSNGSPSAQYPIINFPRFCEWSNNLCDFYLDWRDWREDYNRNEQQAQIDRKQIIENQDRDFQQNKEFYNDVRDFMDEQKDQNNNPLEPDNQQYDIKENENVDLTTHNYIQSASDCPIDRNIPLSMGGYTTNIVISYQSLCSAAIMFKPFVILMSFIAGIFIITNTGRRAETGD